MKAVQRTGLSLHSNRKQKCGRASNQDASHKYVKLEALLVSIERRPHFSARRPGALRVRLGRGDVPRTRRPTAASPCNWRDGSSAGVGGARYVSGMEDVDWASGRPQILEGAEWFRNDLGSFQISARVIWQVEDGPKTSETSQSWNPLEIEHFMT